MNGGSTDQNQVSQIHLGGAVRLGEMLCARICHDLAGAVGAVGSGAELLADEMPPGNEALDLLLGSAQAAASRLRFLRQALSGGGTSIQAAQLSEMTADYFATSPGGARLVLDWPEEIKGQETKGQETKEPDSDEPWGWAPARIVLTLVLLAVECLPRGGTVMVRGRPGSDGAVCVTATGGTLSIGEAVSQLDAGAPDTYGPRGAPGRYLRHLAEQLGLAIGVAMEEDRICFFAKIKD